MITKERLTEWVWDVFDCVWNGGNNRQYFITLSDENEIRFYDWYVGTDVSLNMEKDECVLFQTATETFSYYRIEKKKKPDKFLALMNYIERKIYLDKFPRLKIIFDEVVKEVSKEMRR